jgi:hypothetical protein
MRLVVPTLAKPLLASRRFPRLVPRTRFASISSGFSPNQVSTSWSPVRVTRNESAPRHA